MRTVESPQGAQMLAGFRQHMTIPQVASICGVEIDEAREWWDRWELRGMCPPAGQPLIPRRELIRFMATRDMTIEDESMNELTKANYEIQVKRARDMAGYALLPEHLRGETPEETALNCLKIVDLSDRWNMSPLLVADDTFVVKGRFGFEGKIIAGIANSCGLLDRHLDYEFSGNGDGLTVTVTGRLKGEQKVRAVSWDVKRGKAQSPTYRAGGDNMWDQDPEQKLCYSGAQRWVRRHCPQILFGQFGVDELQSDAPPPRSEIIETSIEPLDQQQLAAEIAEEKAQLSLRDRTAECVKFFRKHGIDQHDLAAAFSLANVTDLSEQQLDRLHRAAEKMRTDNVLPPDAIKEIAMETLAASPEDVDIDGPEWWRRFHESLNRKRSVDGVYNIREAATNENPGAKNRISDACVKRLDEIDKLQKQTA